MKTLNVEECAAMLKVERKTVLKLAGRELRGAKVGRAWVFFEADVVDFLRDRIDREMLPVASPQAANDTFDVQKRVLRRLRRRSKRVIPELPKS